MAPFSSFHTCAVVYPWGSTLLFNPYCISALPKVGLSFCTYFLFPSEQCSHLFDLMVTLLNGTVSRIAQQEAFLFDEIFFSTNTTLLLYLILIGFVFWGYQKKNVDVHPHRGATRGVVDDSC